MKQTKRCALPALALVVPLGLFGHIGEASAQEQDAHLDSAAPSGDDPMGVVRISGPSGARFELELDAVTEQWDTVCTAPCVAHVSTELYYRVAGGGLRPSNRFSLRADPGGTEDLHVSGARMPLYVLGWVVVGVGGVTAGESLSLLLLQASNGALGLGPSTNHPAILWVVFGAGAVGALGGLALVLTNRHTTVSQEVVGKPTAQDREAAQPATQPEIAHADAFAKLVRTGPAFEVPIVSLRF